MLSIDVFQKAIERVSAVGDRSSVDDDDDRMDLRQHLTHLADVRPCGDVISLAESGDEFFNEGRLGTDEGDFTT